MHLHHGIFITLPDRKVQMYDRDFETYMKSFAVFRSRCEEWIGDSKHHDCRGKHGRIPRL